MQQNQLPFAHFTGVYLIITAKLLQIDEILQQIRDIAASVTDLRMTQAEVGSIILVVDFKLPFAFKVKAICFIKQLRIHPSSVS